jgi:regulator of RNase E activity RraB
MAEEQSQVVYDQWDTYVARADDKPLFISFDVEAARADLSGTMTHCARVIIPIKRPNQNGGPVSPESERLYELEDSLCGLLADEGVNCRLVGRLTCDGVRELVFQLDDWDQFRPPVGAWMGENEDYEINVSEHEGWDFFNDCIRPTPETWMWLADQSVVQNLIRAGSDPAKEHALEFVFNGEEPGLRAAAEALRERGYAALEPLDYASGRLVMVLKMPLDADAIFAESRAHAELAAEHEIVYDGWGAAVVN